MLDPTKVLRLIGGRAAYRSFVLGGLEGGHKEEFYKVEDQRFLGAEGFGEEIRENMEETARVPRKIALNKVVEQLAKHLGTEVDVLRSSDRSWRASKTRTLLAYTLIRRLGHRTSEVAAYLGRDIVTVSTLVTRFSERVESDHQIKQTVTELLKNVET